MGLEVIHDSFLDTDKESSAPFLDDVFQMESGLVDIVGD